MELIKNNPYRIVGILSSATERELQKQKTKIKAYSKVGREIKCDYDFQMLPTLIRSEEVIDKAFSDVEQNQNKVNHALFWFLNVSPFDNTAIEYLKGGDEEKAAEIWEKVTRNRGVNSKNFSAFNNLGTYKLLSKDQEDVKEGIEAKIRLIESDFFENFVHSVADMTFNINNEKQIEKLVDELLLQLKGRYSSAEILELFSSCRSSTQKYLSEKFTVEPVNEIERQIESCKSSRKGDVENSYDYGIELFSNTKDNLSLLKSLLGINDLQYQVISDQLANEILQCGIDYFNANNKRGSTNRHLDSAQKLAKLAYSVARGELTTERIKDNLATLEGMRDRELLLAIEVLSFIKEMYDKNKSKILAEVSTLPLGYNESINWSKVNGAIDNSLDWDKIVEHVKKTIAISSVQKIKIADKPSEVNKYKSLVEFLFSKLNYSQKNQVKYLCYWKSTVNMPPVTSGSGGGCYIATMAYGDYDHPQVIELRKFRDDILSKTILGRGFIKYYYRCSPSLVKRLKDKRNINLLIRKVLDQFINTIRK